MSLILNSLKIAMAFGYCKGVNLLHFETLIGQRSSGSQWGKNNLPNSPLWYTRGEWVLVPHSKLPRGVYIDCCEYYRTDSKAILEGSREQIAVLNELPAYLQDAVFLRESVHGWDLLLPKGTTLPYATTDATEAWLILGPASREDNNQIPWTAFPGRILGGLDPDIEGFSGNIEEVDFRLPYAVKVET